MYLRVCDIKLEHVLLRRFPKRLKYLTMHKDSNEIIDIYQSDIALLIFYPLIYILILHIIQTISDFLTSVKNNVNCR